QGRARVVALNRGTGETFSEEIGDGNFAAVYVPGNLAHGFEALTDVLMLYHVSEEYDADDPDENEWPWDDPRVVDLWSTRSPILSERDAPESSSPARAGTSAVRCRTPSPGTSCSRSGTRTG